MNRWYLPSKRRFIRCWSRILGASLLNLNATIGWIDGQGVGSSGAEARSLDPYCSETLRRRMNRCLNRRFIRWFIFNLLAAELIWHVLIIGHRFIRRYVFYFNSSNSACLSFSLILLLQPCSHQLSELDSIQGTWVCIFYIFLECMVNLLVFEPLLIIQSKLQTSNPSVLHLPCDTWN
jgi:hypothetical protein